MAITISDYLTLPAPKPLRDTDIVGLGLPVSGYPTKEALPMYMRHLYMEVTDENGIKWRLEDAFDLTIWTEMTVDATSETTKAITASVDAGGIAIGETVPMGTDITELVEQLIAPLIMPTVSLPNYTILGGVVAATMEVGAQYTQQLFATYNKGLIESKDGHPVVPLTGASTGQTYTGTGITSLGLVSTHIILGANYWHLSENFTGTNTPYYDSQGNVATNLNGLRGPGAVTDVSETITGKYRYWYSVGSIPVNSAGVRALVTRGFYPVTTFSITIPISTPEVAFYLPVGESITVQYKESSYADVTSTFTETVMNVDDAAGIPKSYSRFETTIPGGGYPSQATYIITIN